MMVLAGSELGAIAEPWWASALHIARQQACSPQPDTPEKWLIKGAAGQMPGLLARNFTRCEGESSLVKHKPLFVMFLMKEGREGA